MTQNFIPAHHELLVYQLAIRAATQIFELTLSFPEFEQHLLTQQMLKSSRSVCANLAEAWQRRRYRGAFIAKLNEVEAEAAETQTWVQIAELCRYLSPETGHDLQQQYGVILAAIARLIQNADVWVISS